MQSFYNTIAIPFGWLLNFLYSNIGNYFVSLLILVLFVRLILLPSSINQQKNSAKQLRLQTKVNKIKAKYTNGATTPTREAQMKIQQETQDLYKKEGYNPASAGCLPLLIQFPIMIGLYGVVYTPLTKVLAIKSGIVEALASIMGIATTQGNNQVRYEIQLLKELSSLDLNTLTAKLQQAAESAKITLDNIPKIANEIVQLKKQFNFLGIDLTGSPKISEPNLLWLIPVASFLTAMLTSLVMYSRQKKTNPEIAKNPSMGCMTFMSPFMSLIFAFMFPAGVGVYWVMSNVISFLQTILLNHFYSPEKVTAKIMVDETVERRSREENVKKLKEFKE